MTFKVTPTSETDKRLAPSQAAISHRSDTKRLNRQAIAGGARAGGGLAEGAAQGRRFVEVDADTPCTGCLAGGSTEGSGAPKDAHKGQSIEATATASWPSTSSMTRRIDPEAEHTCSIDCGATRGDTTPTTR